MKVMNKNVQGNMKTGLGIKNLVSPEIVNKAKSKIINGTYSNNPTWSTSYITIGNPTLKTNGKSNSIAQKADILPKLWCQKSCATRGKIAIESRIPTKGMTQKIDK